MASYTQQICSRHSEPTVRFDAEDHDACENSGVTTRKVFDPGSGMSDNGNVRRELRWHMQSNTQ